MSVIEIKYEACNLGREVTLPLSKSIALRAMTLNVVSQLLGHGCVANMTLPNSEDIDGMFRAVNIFSDNSGVGTHSVHIGAGGAPFRFFTALAASATGCDVTVTADPALMKRPNAPLFDALRNAGADIKCLGNEGYAPIHISGRLLSPKKVDVDSTISSQYLSALLMAAPLWKGGAIIPFSKEHAVSQPYLEMTLNLMKKFGCNVEMTEDSLRVSAGKCTSPERFVVEGDWSAASYFYESALLAPGKKIRIKNLYPASESVQGDAACEKIFQMVGVNTIYHPDGSATLLCDSRKRDEIRESRKVITLNLNGTPDLVPALAVAFCLAEIQFRFEGIAHLRHKETDRMGAVAAELRKLGYLLTTDSDSMSWRGERCEVETDAPTISTYSDHRMAMAFAPAALVTGRILIANPDVVKKSYPEYWENLLGS